jgi:predicted MPP superfamily phosphohydrolase
MPWVLSLALIIAVPLFGIYYYDIKLLLNSSAALFGWDRRKTRRWILWYCLLVNLLPVAALVTWFAGGRDAMTAFTGEVRLVDFLLVYPFWISLVVAVQFFLLLAIWELSKYFLWPWYRKKRNSWHAAEIRFVVLALLFTVMYAAGRIYADTWVVRVNEREVELPTEYSGLDGLRIAQFSDIHGDARTDSVRIQSFIEKVNSLHPDLIFFAGDVVSSGEKYIASTTHLFSRFKARVAKIAAVGDHEMFTNKSVIVSGLRKAGFAVAEDSTLHLTVDSTSISVTDVVYTYRQRPSATDLQRASDDAVGAYKILLVHQPAEELVQFASVRGYNLFIAGHSHGGVVAFGIPGIILWAPSRLETKYFTGFFQVGKMFVSITNGLGHTLAPIRYQAPVEVTVLKLVKK